MKIWIKCRIVLMDNGRYEVQQRAVNPLLWLSISPFWDTMDDNCFDYGTLEEAQEALHRLTAPRGDRVAKVIEEKWKC